jgi:hypothetical protein
MRALEDLVNSVRDPRSRRHLEEAVRAYNAGALRAAIISTWVAVALDLTDKIRELAETGDGAAADYVRRLDDAIAGEAIARLQQLERGLLPVTHGTFEFITKRELDELKRLQSDRHACAHPAYVAPAEVFDPTPELVRAHIATAVDAVLSKPPILGRKAVARFETEIALASFPQSLDDLVPYLRDRYIRPGRSALHTNLAKYIVRLCCLDPPVVDARIRVRAALSVRALERISPALLSEALTEVITKREQGSGLTDDDLLRFAGNLGDLPLAWNALPESSHSRVYEALKTVDVQRLVDHGVFLCDIASGPAKDIVDDRLGQLDGGQLAQVIGIRRNPRFVDAAIRLLRDSDHMGAVQRHMETLVLPLAVDMTADQIRRVLGCVRDSRLIRMTYHMPSLMVEFFLRTRSAFPECYTDWYDLVEWLSTSARDEDMDERFAYPELRWKVHPDRTGGVH